MPLPDVSPADFDTDFGEEPDVSEKTLEPKNRAINSVQQAYSVSETLIYDASRKIKQAAQITAKINGQAPKNPTEQLKQAKSWQSNTSTGALATTCSKIPPRLWMPIQNSRYLTSASLPEGTPDGAHKTEFYRTVITKKIKSWPKWRFFIQALTRETSYYGYAFTGFLDNYEWRPTMFRMDRAFVPAGTQIMDESVPFFAVKYDYLPGELLKLLKANVDADRDEWDRENVVAAINAAAPPNRSGSPENVRSLQDMIRSGTQWLSYTKGAKVIQTIHLFASEMDGKVSHYVLLSDDTGGAYNSLEGSSSNKQGLLYQQLDQFDSMRDVMSAFVFEYGNGTIQGSLGAGQILYDMSVQVELARNDAFDNLKMASRVKLQVTDPKDVNQVKMTVMDDKVIVGGATYQGVNANLSTNVEASIQLDQYNRGLMEEKVGAFLPPVAIPGTSPTATQVNVQVEREREISNAILENFLMQFGLLTHSIERRLTDPESTDAEAKKLRKELLKKLSTEEIKMLRDTEPTESILAFTDVIVKQQAAFAASKTQGPNAAMYDQFQLEQFQSQAMVGIDLTSVILPPGEDENQAQVAARQQLLEGTTMGSGMVVPVTKGDNHWVHMQVLKPAMISVLEQASKDPAKIPMGNSFIQHYSTHYEMGVAAKTIPKDQINAEKKLIRSWQVALESAQQRAAAQQRIDQVKKAQAGLADGELSPEEAVRDIPEQPSENVPTQ